MIHAINWEAVQAIASSALVITSAGAISYAALQLRHEREYRSVNNLEKQLSFFLGGSFAEARRRLAQARVGPDGLLPWSIDNPPVAAFEVLDFYEHLGLLVKKGHLHVYDVWHTFYEWAQPVYVDLQALIESPESSYADHYSDLRKLLRGMDEIQIKRMHAKNANHWALWTPERILDYYRYELEIQTSDPLHRRHFRLASSQSTPHAHEPEKMRASQSSETPLRALSAARDTSQSAGSTQHPSGRTHSLPESPLTQESAADHPHSSSP